MKLKSMLKLDPRTFAMDTLYYIGGSVLYALGLFTFASGAGFATGGVSGISLIISHFTGMPLGTLNLIINIPIVLGCARILGLPFMFKSVYVMLINTLFLDVIFPHFPTYQGNELLAAMFTGVAMGAGLALIYMRGASTGGMDFVTMSIKKKRPYFSVGSIGVVSDMIIILSGGLAFGQIDAVLYGAITSFGSNLVINQMLYGAGSSKMAIIITDLGQQIADAISVEVERGSTLLKSRGSYTGEEHDMLLCVCSKNEIFKVRTAARATDPNSIIVITDASEVLGEGFHPPALPGNEDPAKAALAALKKKAADAEVALAKATLASGDAEMAAPADEAKKDPENTH